MFLVTNSFSQLKYKFQFVLRLKAIEYYKELFYYLFFYIKLQVFLL